MARKLTLAILMSLAQACGLVAALLGTGPVGWAGVAVAVAACPIAVEMWGAVFGADEDDDELEVL